MTSVEVHVDTNRVELLNSVCNGGLKELNENGYGPRNTYMHTRYVV